MKANIKKRLQKEAPHLFDQIRYFPIEERKSKITVQDILLAKSDRAGFQFAWQQVKHILRKDFSNRPKVFVFFGAHLIKNGGQRYLMSLIQRNRIHFLATNGASMVHDLELAAFGKTSEYVEENLPIGKFGMWKETQKLFGDIFSSPWRDSGLGDWVGFFIYDGGRIFPRSSISLFRKCYQKHVPLFVFPGIGQDIFNLGRTFNEDIEELAWMAYVDFQQLVAALVLYGENSIVLSLGSSVMAPQVFEKALSAAINIKKRFIKFKRIYVVDLKPSGTTKDWDKGVPSEDEASYYDRTQKSFRRSKSPVKYVQADHKDFLACVDSVCQ